MDKLRGKDYGFKGLIPLFVFLILYVGAGFLFTFLGVEKPFTMLPRQVAILIAIMFALVYFDRGRKFKEKLDLYTKGAGDTGVMTLGLIVLMAGGFSSVVSAIGGEESIVNLGVSLIPSELIIPGVFAICAIISISIGTSMGTIVTMMPVTFALVHGAGLDAGMAGAAVITGSYFGDGLSMISATSITAANGVGADMKEKFLNHLKLAIPAALVTLVLYAIVSAGSTSAVEYEAGNYNLLTILPYLAVLVLAVLGMDVILVLGIGIIIAVAIGMSIGSVTFFESTQAIGTGMEGMFWLAVFAMMVSGLVGIMRYYGGVEWLINVIKKKINGSKSCESLIGVLSLVLSATIVNNVIAVIMTAPIAKELGDKYEVQPKRMATIMDIGAVAATMIIPHGTGVMMVQAASGVSYLDIIKYEFYPLVIIIFAAISIYISSRVVRSKGRAKLENIS